MGNAPQDGWSVEHYGFSDLGDLGEESAPRSRTGARPSPRRPRPWRGKGAIAAALTLSLGSVVGFVLGIAGVATADAGPGPEHGHVRHAEITATIDSRGAADDGRQHH